MLVDSNCKAPNIKWPPKLYVWSGSKVFSKCSTYPESTQFWGQLIILSIPFGAIIVAHKLL